MTIVYFISTSGRVPTDATILNIIKEMSAECNVQESKFTYRCGPLVNNPQTLLNELSAKDISQWEIVFIREGKDVIRLDSNGKTKFIESLEANTQPDMLSGDILFQILESN